MSQKTIETPVNPYAESIQRADKFIILAEEKGIISFPTYGAQMEFKRLLQAAFADEQLSGVIRITNQIYGVKDGT